MSGGIIIQARLGSTRLPEKVLLPVGKSEQPLISYMIERLQHHLSLPIIVAVPDNSRNDPLYSALKTLELECFCGPEDDVLKRYYDCATHYKFQTIIRLTSDCPLVDPLLVIDMLSAFSAGDLDYLGNTTPPEDSYFPDGSDVEIFTADALAHAHRTETDARLREHVTFQFWDPSDAYRSRTYPGQTDNSDLRYTVDNIEDYHVVSDIIAALGGNGSDFRGDDIVAFLRANPEIIMKNNQYKPGDNW
jgi:spore coat polysaccharide biosynthesis protein SpsF